MQKILITGAAGDVGTRLRRLMKGIYPSIRVSDVRTPVELGKEEDFIAADLADLAQVKKIVASVDGIVHLGGFSVEGPWETIHKSNIVGCYNLFEAAYRAGVKRVVFASSNHAVGFYRRDQKIGVDVTVRPDSRYGMGNRCAGRDWRRPILDELIALANDVFLHGQMLVDAPSMHCRSIKKARFRLERRMRPIFATAC